ncbi:signal peptidase I [Enterococcus sp. 669A]|uniref:Signal peptidase I n=1 Tax=Candidatus Enterococcus moelleringii TaxID=2815325 RepID=A0ABS3L9E4_9ENTE|nr:signal peptidase I [Enterococcus sp. 669A]MBO1306235.1 signal peptidase I [Enterococcus sp. 669A]
MKLYAKVFGKALVFVAALLILFGWVHRSYLIHPVAGTSMQEALQDGDRILLSKRSPIVRYSVIGFSMPEEDGMFVKRVIGLPGDSVLVQGNRLVLSIGDEGFTTTYTFDLDAKAARQLKKTTTIPEGHYFVIGDHTAVSKDSRTFGWVQAADIEGKVQYRLYPFSAFGPIN